MSRHSGFTLLEMVITIVLIGIVAGILAPFYRQAGEMFADTRARTELTAKGRLALERISRELREAYPNDIAVTTSTLDFRQLEDLTSLAMKGSIPEKKYRVYKKLGLCKKLGVSHTGNNLNWDDDGDGTDDAILVDGVDTVTFTYSQGSTRRSAVVTIDLTLIDGDESIRLFREVHIRNTRGDSDCP